MLNVGDIVVCINASGIAESHRNWLLSNPPLEGNYYTIRSTFIVPGGEYGGTPSVLLNEVKCKIHELYNMEVGFGEYRFRKMVSEHSEKSLVKSIQESR